MAHSLLGTVVLLTRPVIVKPGFRRTNEETNQPEDVAATVEMQEVPAIVVGVEPRYDADDGTALCPNLHLAFLHPERLQHVTGSGWRDAFDRLLSVRPLTHPDVDPDQPSPYYSSEEVEDEDRYLRRKQRLADEKAAADQKLAEEKSRQAEAEAEAAKAKSQPSASDLDTHLDRVADEEAAKQATSGEAAIAPPAPDATSASSATDAAGLMGSAVAPDETPATSEPAAETTTE